MVEAQIGSESFDRGGHRSCGPASFQPCFGILDDQAPTRRHSQCLGSEEVSLGIRFPRGHVIDRDEHRRVYAYRPQAGSRQPAVSAGDHCPSEFVFDESFDQAVCSNGWHNIV